MKVFKDMVNLKANRARVAFLDKQIARLQAYVKQIENDIHVPVAAFDDPAGFIRPTGTYSNPTMRAALDDLPDDVRQLIEDIRAMTIEKYRTTARIELAEQALDFLTQKERMIFELRALESLSWYDVVDEYFEKTGNLINERTARNIYERAAKRIEPFFESDTVANEKYSRFTM